MHGAVDSQALVRLLEQLDGDEECLAEVTAMYLGELPGRVAAVRAAIEQGDTHAVERAAHSLKGTSGTFGAAGLAALCERVEQDARIGALRDARAILAELERERDRVAVELAAICRDAA